MSLPQGYTAGSHTHATHILLLRAPSWLCKEERPIWSTSPRGKYQREMTAVAGGSLWGTLLSKGVSWPAEWGGRARWPQTCPRCHCTMILWVWVKRTGEQTCFSDLKHLGWVTLVEASVREGSSSSLAAITIQLTFMLSLRTQAKRAALLTHPQSPAKVYISWIVNSWMFSKLPPPAMKEPMGRTATFPHAVQDNRARAVGDFQTAAGTATQSGGCCNSTARSHSAAASAGPQGDVQQDRNNSYLWLRGVRQAGFLESCLNEDGPVHPMPRCGPHVFSCHGAQQALWFQRRMQPTGEASPQQEMKGEGTGERTLHLVRLGFTVWVHRGSPVQLQALVPALSLSFPIYKNEDHCLSCKVTANIRV